MKSVASYLSYFTDAFLVSMVGRYNIHGKKLLESYEKLYFGDYVISMTPLVKRSDKEGITHLGLREFLKNGF